MSIRSSLLSLQGPSASFQDSFWGPNGFEELKRHIKQGEDFCKDVLAVLQERYELEASYARGLAKLSTKLAKASREVIGTTAQSWHGVAEAMDIEAEIHRNLAQGLSEDIVKPLKTSIEIQHKTRKSIESPVDKKHKNLLDRRCEEQKVKKASYTCAKENERVQDQMLEAKAGKLITDKEVTKLEMKKRKAEEALDKADKEYYLACLRAERSRQEWESSVFKAGGQFQQLEEDRLNIMQDFVQKYANHFRILGPKMTESAERLADTVSGIDVQLDIQTAIRVRGTGQNVPEQILPDFFAENLNNKMKRERRQQSLEKFMTLLMHDLELERKGKQGLENLARVYQESNNFGDADAQQDVSDQLKHMRAMLTYLEATRFKLCCAVADVENSPRPSHPLAQHMEQLRDKQGMTVTVLKLPQWVQLDRRLSGGGSSASSSASSVTDGLYYDSGPGEGSSLSVVNGTPEPIYANLSEVQNSSLNHQSPQCRALYDYRANLDDELSIHSGDVITIHEKADDGWWQGELNGAVGLFPASYVQELP